MIEHEIIYHAQNQIFEKELSRNAVRAVVTNNDKYLLIHSQKIGDYKFPGGGINIGESQHEALFREVLEECGMNLKSIDNQLLRIIEMSQSNESSKIQFKMTSDYFKCTINTEKFEQKLDDYEQDLGFTPVWIGIEEALLSNKEIVKSNVTNLPPWIHREIWAMEKIIENNHT